MSETEKLQTELNHYKQLLGVGDVATRGYAVIVKQLEQQITFLDGFDLKTSIGEAKKETPIYERAQEIFKDMPKIILSMKELKDKLGIEYVEKVERMTATTPQSIGLPKSNI